MIKSESNFLNQILINICDNYQQITLRIICNTIQDRLQFSATSINLNEVILKRNILSSIAKMYLLGLLWSVFIIAKFLRIKYIAVQEGLLWKYVLPKLNLIKKL